MDQPSFRFNNELKIYLRKCVNAVKKKVNNRGNLNKQLLP